MKVTLKEAVEYQLKEKLNEKKNFSAHDVTRAIRNWLLKDIDNNFISDATSMVTIDEKFVDRVEHHSVRDLVHTEMQNFPEFVADSSGPFILYKFVGIQTAVS